MVIGFSPDGVESNSNSSGKRAVWKEGKKQKQIPRAKVSLGMTKVLQWAAGQENSKYGHGFSVPERVDQPWRERFLKIKKPEAALITARSKPMPKR
jgi:hypothetical protein